MSRDEYDSVRQEYSRLADHYDTRWKPYVAASIRETLKRVDVKSGEAILDVGCGTGELLEALSRSDPGAKLSGMDLSAEMLQVARGKLGTPVVLKEGRAEALPFKDSLFNLVISTNVFHFVRHPGTALFEIRRVLKPGGMVLITDWCDDYLACRVCDIFLRAFSRGHFRTYSSRECYRLLGKADFREIKVERYRISWLWGLMTAIALRPGQTKQETLF